MGILSAKCLSKTRLDGKTALVTGCNTGIGKETVKDFYQRGANVIMACRNLKAAQQAIDDIQKNNKEKNCGELKLIELDLSNLKSVRKCVETLNEEKLNLVNNAGIMMRPFTKTEDGFELQFATNHLGHFLLTILLLPKLIKSVPSRIVTVSSCLHVGGKINFSDLNLEKNYNPLKAYKQSKLANILFMKELSKQLQLKQIYGVNTYSLHPGVIASDLSRHLDHYMYGLTKIYDNLAKIFAKNVKQGAQTIIYCSVDENCSNQSGLYYEECRVKEHSINAKNEETAKKLWEVSL